MMCSILLVENGILVSVNATKLNGDDRCTAIAGG
jgi:hypothetical protein